MFRMTYFPFKQENKFIFLKGYRLTMTYNKFNKLLKAKDTKLLSLFPGLTLCKQEMTCDKLFDAAVQQVEDDFTKVYKDNPDNITKVYKAITNKYDKYTLCSYLTKVAKWTKAMINLHDMGNAHVVFKNGVSYTVICLALFSYIPQ